MFLERRNSPSIGLRTTSVERSLRRDFHPWAFWKNCERLDTRYPQSQVALRFAGMSVWIVSAAPKIVDLPLKRTELGKSQEISCVRGDHSDPQAGSAHCNQRIIRQSALSNFLVIILGGQTGEYFASLGPVVEARYQNSPRLLEVTLESFQHMPTARSNSGV